MGYSHEKDESRINNRNYDTHDMHTCMRKQLTPNKSDIRSETIIEILQTIYFERHSSPLFIEYNSDVRDKKQAIAFLC